mmetsp:Transcript_145781/g.257104  ORF Transcript_145781/g.257104 Transcript_145781/m.257104 type:complete len:271 (-) Transcript_145781:63-875(-)
MVSRKRAADTRTRKESAAIMAQVLHERQSKDKLTAELAALSVGDRLPVSFSQLTRVYLPFVERLHRQGLPVAYGEPFYSIALKNSSWTRVALWNGCVVGSLICKVSEDIIGCIHVQTLVSAFPRKRIASQLLENLLADAANFGFSKSSLCVHVKNASAVALYTSWGYKVVETRIDYYASNASKLEAPPDAFFMLRESGCNESDSAQTPGGSPPGADSGSMPDSCASEHAPDLEKAESTAGGSDVNCPATGVAARAKRRRVECAGSGSASE